MLLWRRSIEVLLYCVVIMFCGVIKERKSLFVTHLFVTRVSIITYKDTWRAGMWVRTALLSAKRPVDVAFFPRAANLTVSASTVFLTTRQRYRPITFRVDTILISISDVHQRWILLWLAKNLFQLARCSPETPRPPTSVPGVCGRCAACPNWPRSCCGRGSTSTLTIPTQPRRRNTDWRTKLDSVTRR